MTLQSRFSPLAEDFLFFSVSEISTDLKSDCTQPHQHLAFVPSLLPALTVTVFDFQRDSGERLIRPLFTDFERGKDTEQKKTGSR